MVGRGGLSNSTLSPSDIGSDCRMSWCSSPIKCAIRVGLRGMTVDTSIISAGLLGVFLAVGAGGVSNSILGPSDIGSDCRKSWCSSSIKCPNRVGLRGKRVETSRAASSPSLDKRFCEDEAGKVRFVFVGEEDEGGLIGDLVDRNGVGWSFLVGDFCLFGVGSSFTGDLLSLSLVVGNPLPTRALNSDDSSISKLIRSGIDISAIIDCEMFISG
jgi:hypothetical protein